MTYERIESEGGLQWPYPAGTTDVSPSRLYADGWYEHEGGKALALLLVDNPVKSDVIEQFRQIPNILSAKVVHV